MRRILLFLSLSLPHLLGAQQAVVSGLKAELNPANRNEVVVSWTAASAEQVSGFRIARSIRTETNYLVVHAMQINAGDIPSGGREFRFVDNGVFKPGEGADAVFYKLLIDYRNGSVDERGPVSVNYTSTAIRRTWGSIKSMFQ
jgi:hypothetical protein